MVAHHIERVGTRDYCCRACAWTWARRPTSSCPGVPRYAWWDSVPAHLRTKTHLQHEGLKPAGPIRGCVEGTRTWAGETWYWLYDIAEAIPKRATTPAQRNALARARDASERTRRTCPRCARLADYDLNGDVYVMCEIEDEEAERAADRAGVVVWAADLRGRSDWLVLDTETTGLDGDAEIVELALVTPNGEVLLDTRVRPDTAIPAEASAVHGITDADVAAAPTFPEIYQCLVDLLPRRTVVAYNADFDRAMLHAAYSRHGLRRPAPVRWSCAMERYAAYTGEWSDDWGDYRWQRLPGGGHRALDDCRAVLTLIRLMAATAAEGGP